MSKYSFESVEYKHVPSVNAFVTSIEISSYHWHYQYEILFVFRGRIRLRVDQYEYYLNAGDIILLNMKAIHSIQGEAGNLCGIIQIDSSLFKVDANDRRQIRFFLNTATDECDGADMVKHHVAAILSCTLREDNIGFFKLRGEVYSLIADLIENADYDSIFTSGEEPDTSKEMTAITDFIRANLAEPDLAELTQKQFGISGKTLYRYFKGTLGISVKDFVDEIRIEAARKLLRESEKDIGYIMDHCGFASEKTFYRTFHKFTGQTPGSYRKKIFGVTGDDGDIKGYLDFEPYEAAELLNQIMAKV